MFRTANLRQRLAETSQPEASACNAVDGGYGERKRLLENAKAFAVAVKDLG